MRNILCNHSMRYLLYTLFQSLHGFWQSKRWLCKNKTLGIKPCHRDHTSVLIFSWNGKVFTIVVAEYWISNLAVMWDSGAWNFPDPWNNYFGRFQTLFKQNTTNLFKNSRQTILIEILTCEFLHEIEMIFWPLHKNAST